MNNNGQYGINTECVHAGIKVDNTGAVVTPIYQTSTFRFKNADHGARLFRGEEDGYIYTRMRNPTVEAMEDAVAALEHGYKAVGCATGMAAVHLIFAAELKAGDHVICGESVYGPTSTILNTFFSKFGVEVTFVDTADLNAVKNAFRPNTKLVHIESPGNPTLVICDIQAIADMTHKANARLSIDNTFMSPILQQPFSLGADVVMHSMTKFLNGHADVVAGVVILKNAEDYARYRKTCNLVGGTIDPFNSFLVHRGIKTLKLRVEEQTKSAMIIAEYLEKHPKIEWVRYPGLASHPQHELAKRQMSGFGAMIACELKGGLEAGKILMDNVQVWQLAVSLGGIESLVQHPASMTHSSMSKEQREQAKITDGLVRIAVGIENVEDLIQGMEAGLSKI